MPWDAADTGTIALGPTETDIGLDRVELTVERGQLAHLTFTFATTRTTRANVVMPIDLPAHAVVRELIVTQRGHRAVGTPTSMWHASEIYGSLVDRERDPALVEADGRDRVRLHLFPLARGARAVVELTIDLPPLASLVLDPGGHAIGELELAGHRERRVTEPQTLELDTSAPRIDDARPAVDGLTSLYAGPPVHPLEPATLIDASDPAHPSHPIHEAALRACYVAAAGRDPTLVGTYRVRLAVAVDGRIERATAEGLDHDPVARACARDELSSWQLHAGDGELAITYEVTLRPEVLTHPRWRPALD